MSDQHATIPSSLTTGGDGLDAEIRAATEALDADLDELSPDDLQTQPMPEESVARPVDDTTADDLTLSDLIGELDDVEQTSDAELAAAVVADNSLALNATNRQHIVRLLAALAPSDEDEFKALMQDETHIVPRLAKILSTYSQTASDERDLLNEEGRPTPVRVLRDPDSKKPILGSTSFTPRRPADAKNDEPLTVSGKGALAHFLTPAAGSSGPLRQVPLYASGFTLTLRPPELEHTARFNYLFTDISKRLGMQLGGSSYAFNGSELLGGLMSIILEPYNGLVMGCDLEGWEQTGYLEEMILLSDTRHILMEVLDAMFPQGYEGLYHRCHACGHDTLPPGGKVKLREFIRHDFHRMPADAIAHMQRSIRPGSTTKPDQIKMYRDQLGLRTSTTFNGAFHLDVRPPTLRSYLDTAARFISDVTASTYGNTNNRKLIENLSVVRYNRQFTPWVEAIKLLRADGSVQTQALDPEAIDAIFDHITTNDPKEDFRISLGKIINNMSLTHSCYAAFSCERCGAEPPTNKVGGFMTVDPLQLFFYAVQIKLGTP